MIRRTLLLAAALALLATPAAAQDARKQPLPAEVIAASKPEDWRRPDPKHTLYLEMPGGRVTIELAPQFAPLHVENMRALAAEGGYAGAAVLRVQDNYVTQWGRGDELPDPEFKTAKASLPPEFTVKGGAASLPFAKLPDPDAYAPEVGIVGGFPAGRDPATGEAWMAHCYGIVGVGRGMAADTGNGGSLYVVIGHSPRALDRNITLVGRVLEGMELLTALPRGTGRLGFYERPEQRAPITAIRFADSVPEAERTAVEVLRSDRPVFMEWVEARRQRKDDFFHVPSGRLDLCNALPPVRKAGG